MSNEKWRLSAGEIADGIRRGELSSREALEDCLERIHATNETLNTLTEIRADDAMAADAIVVEGQALAKSVTDYYPPRHRHHFDQFRFQREGEFDFSKDGKSPPGTVIYPPESVPCGPQTPSDASLTLVLYF